MHPKATVSFLYTKKLTPEFQEESDQLTWFSEFLFIGAFSLFQVGESSKVREGNGIQESF